MVNTPNKAFCACTFMVLAKILPSFKRLFISNACLETCISYPISFQYVQVYLQKRGFQKIKEFLICWSMYAHPTMYWQTPLVGLVWRNRPTKINPFLCNFLKNIFKSIHLYAHIVIQYGCPCMLVNLYLCGTSHAQIPIWKDGWKFLIMHEIRN